MVAICEAWAVAHREASPPVAAAERGSVFDLAIVHEDDILQATARHVAPLDAWVGEVDVGEFLQHPTLDPSGSRPALFRIVEEAFQAAPRVDGIGGPIAVQVEQANLWISQLALE